MQFCIVTFSFFPNTIVMGSSFHAKLQKDYIVQLHLTISQQCMCNVYDARCQDLEKWLKTCDVHTRPNPCCRHYFSVCLSFSPYFLVFVWRYFYLYILPAFFFSILLLPNAFSRIGIEAALIQLKLEGNTDAEKSRVLEVKRKRNMNSGKGSETTWITHR